jgi:hypothetical protein
MESEATVSLLDVLALLVPEGMTGHLVLPFWQAENFETNCIAESRPAWRQVSNQSVLIYLRSGTRHGSVYE